MRLNDEDHVSARDWPFPAALTCELFLSALIVLMVVAWAPLYVQWPRSGNHEHFASMAFGWTRDLLPYRDLMTINFPGEIYIFWILGQICGWSSEWSIYAFDLLCLAALGAFLLVWSRRVTRRYIAALGTIALYLSYYTTQWYYTAAERESHVAVFAIVCILLPLGWKGAWSAVACGVISALAFVVRPHFVTFTPAIAAAFIFTDAEQLRCSPGFRFVGRWFVALVAAIVTSVLCWAPLVWAGLRPDFLQSMQLNISSKFTPLEGFARPAVSTLLREVFWAKPYLGLSILIAVGSIFAGWIRWRAVWVVVLLAQLGGLAYMWVHPARHNYLEHPLMATWALGLGLFLAEIGAAPIERGWAVTIGLVLALSFQYPHTNFMGSFRLAARSMLGKAARIDAWRRQASTCFSLSWEEFTELRHWIADNTTLDTRLANLTPGIILGSDVNRLPAIPIEGTWLWYHHDTEPAVREALQAERDIVVLWNPETFEDQIGSFPELIDVIKTDYESVARFGPMEVRRKR
jgi:hypothetical protein